MTVPFNKEVISEAIQEVLAEGSKTVIVGNPSQTAQDIMNDPDVDSTAKKTAVDAIKKGMKGDKVEVPTKSMEEDHHENPNDDSDMAKSQLYGIAKYAIELLQMIKDGDPLDAWVQAKITKAADYVDAVQHYLEGEEYLDANQEEPEEDLDEARDYQALVGKEVMFGSRLAAVVGEEGDYIRLKFEDGKENLVSKSDFENKQPGVNEEEEIDDSKFSKKDAKKEKGFATQSSADQAKAALRKKLDPVLDTLEKKGIISRVDGKRKINDVDAYKKAIAAISEVLSESKATCCGKCGRTHVKGTECKKPFLTGQDHCRVR